ncbi:hypothetical protein F5B19DRAFT_468784 [Rostrohypoxylon terebratum]|nr:hypothetical protein F5B19DRAFT_468784 [Rostrohypoxylon terebratum]
MRTLSITTIILQFAATFAVAAPTAHNTLLDPATVSRRDTARAVNHLASRDEAEIAVADGFKRREETDIGLGDGFKKREDAEVQVGDGFKKRGNEDVDVGDGFKKREDEDVDVADGF